MPLLSLGLVLILYTRGAFAILSIYKNQTVLLLTA